MWGWLIFIRDIEFGVRAACSIAHLCCLEVRRVCLLNFVWRYVNWGGNFGSIMKINKTKELLVIMFIFIWRGVVETVTRRNFSSNGNKNLCMLSRIHRHQQMNRYNSLKEYDEEVLNIKQTI